MEKLGNEEKEIGYYSPFEGLSIDFDSMKWELVTFIFPKCNQNCSHCWSSKINFGNTVPLTWYETFWSNINPKNVSLIKLTGGEPTLYNDLPKLISLIRKYIKSDIPIQIFTNGSKLIKLGSNQSDINTTIANLRQLVGNNENIEIHLSADEHHAGSLFRSKNNINSSPKELNIISEENQFGHDLIKNMVDNFITAIEFLNNKENCSIKGKLKIHCETNRLSFHRKVLYNHLSEELWNKFVISSEGIIKSGNSEILNNTIEIKESNMLSAFILPGAGIYSSMQSQNSDKYICQDGKNLFIDKSSSGGVVILGWWNLINKKFIGGTTKEFLNIIK